MEWDGFCWDCGCMRKISSEDGRNAVNAYSCLMMWHVLMESYTSCY